MLTTLRLGHTFTSAIDNECDQSGGIRRVCVAALWPQLLAQNAPQGLPFELKVFWLEFALHARLGGEKTLDHVCPNADDAGFHAGHKDELIVELDETSAHGAGDRVAHEQPA